MGMKDDIMAVRKDLEEVKEQSIAMEIVRDLKRQNKRQFITIIVILFMWFATGIYLLYLLNDIGTIEEKTISQNNEGGYNNFIGNDGDINNG